MPGYLVNILAIFAASLPGVVVALLSFYLQQRRDNQNLRRLYASARRLLAIEAETFAAFAEKELAGVDQMDRVLKSITEFYSSLVTLTTDDKAELAKNMEGRFWANDLSRLRYPTYSKLADAIRQVLGAPSPMGS